MAWAVGDRWWIVAALSSVFLTKQLFLHIGLKRQTSVMVLTSLSRLRVPNDGSKWITKKNRLLYYFMNHINTKLKCTVCESLQKAKKKKKTSLPPLLTRSLQSIWILIFCVCACVCVCLLVCYNPAVYYSLNSEFHNKINSELQCPLFNNTDMQEHIRVHV